MSFLPLNNPAWYAAKSVFDFRVVDLNGDYIKLKDKYENHVCIIVNTASDCPLTEIHFSQLNELMDKYGDSEGLRILAFPCNQFGQKEPYNSEQIAEIYQEHNVKFDVLAKVNVNCNDAFGLFRFLKKKMTSKSKFGDMIKWNYTKFIVDKRGKPVARFGHDVFPMELEEVLKETFKDKSKKKRKMIVPEIVCAATIELAEIEERKPSIHYI